jgi:hypothetical protein
VGPDEKKKWIFRGAIGAAVALAIVVALKSKSGGDPSLTDAGVVSVAPVPAPEALLFDAYVTTPNTSWTKLQRGIGGAAGILPATLPGVVVAMTDLDPQLAGELDGTSPMFGAAAGDPARPAFTFAMKVTDPRRARMLLVDGETARYAPQESPGMTFLVPKTHPQDQKLAVALSANGFLLVGYTRADVEKLGPYVARTLPSRPLATDTAAVIDVPRSALGTVLKPRLERAWQDAKAFLHLEDERMRKERGGRAPDFGDPSAIIAAVDPIITRRISVVGDLAALRITIDVADDAAFVTTTMKPQGGAAKEWIDGMTIGDATPLLSLPATSAFALVTRDAEPSRNAQIEELEKGMTSALGPRLKDEDKKRLHDVFADVSKARGDTLAVAVSLDEPTGSIVRFPVRDEAAAQKSIKGALDLAQVDPFKEILRVKTVTSSTEDLKDIGKASVATIAREPKKKEGLSKDKEKDAGAPKPETVGLAWFIDGKELNVAAGSEPTVTLHFGAKPEKKLETEPSIMRFSGTVGQTASTIVVAQPLRADPKRANLPTAPLAIAIGRKGSDGFVRVEIADGLLREVARWQLGF